MTRLPRKGYSLRSNMHRWQKQINLPLADDGGRSEAVPEVIRGQEVTWVDMKGLGVHTVSKPPEPMAANAKKFQLPVQAKKPAAAAKLPFRYEVPDGWAKKANSRSAASWWTSTMIADGKQGRGGDA